VNGRPLLIRGGGWASDLLLRPVPKRVDAQLRYARQMGLNTIRLEGKLESDRFFDDADRLGILVLPGWMCCDAWQNNWGWSGQDQAVARGSMVSQARRLRNHPSVIAFLIGSDQAPRPVLERMYVHALRGANWPDPILGSASDDETPLLGRTGVKMTGPYEWVPPVYWYARRAPGGDRGFNTETSAGASIPEIESLRRMLTPVERQALWRTPSRRQSHAGVGDSVFKNFSVFARAMDARFGRPGSLATFVRDAQAMQYENERAMFEAFSANRYRATGVIQWMFNNAWPSLHWNLFDYYLEPNGSTFGAQKANEAVHIQYDYRTHGVIVVNDRPSPAGLFTANAEVFGVDGRRRYARSATVWLSGDDVRRPFAIPSLPHLSRAYFLRLRLFGPRSGRVSTNTYWLSTAPETLAWRRTNWYLTPTRTYANLRALSDLPAVRPVVTACIARDGRQGSTMRVTVSNDGPHVLFFVRLRLANTHGGDIVPVHWSDDDLTLMPGERRVVRVSYGSGDAARLVANGWNMSTTVLPSPPRCAA
jgi:exo-1,4-beta-D-glucosaminidase